MTAAFLLALGVVLVVAGVAMYSVPAGLITAGLLLLALAYTVQYVKVKGRTDEVS